MRETFRHGWARRIGLLAVAVLTSLAGGHVATASAATVRANIHIKGAGTVTGSTGPCTSSDQNDRNTLDCAQQVLVNDAAFTVTMTLTASPSSFPSGQWKFVQWQGCDVDPVDKTKCTITSPIAGAATFDVTATFADTTPPTIVSGPTVSYSNVADRTASFSYSYNEVVPTVQCQIDGGAFGACQSSYVLSEGSHTFGVRAFDSSGNLSTTSTTPVTIVDTALTAGPAQGSLTNSRSAHFGYSTVGGNSFECSLDGAAFASCPTTGIDYANLADGAHTFAVRARNGGFFDHLAATRNWSVDATPPQTTLDPTTGPGEGSIVTLLTASFAFTSNEPATFQCSRDGAAFTACTSPQTLSALGAGQHTFAVRAIDTAGNIDATPAVRAWTVAPLDSDHDGYNAAVDCNDNDPAINPGAQEIPDNAVDENCDGVLGVNLDRDGDGVQRPLDCDDTNPAIHPGAVDTPDDGIDQDCSGTDAHVAPRPLDKLSVALDYFGTFGTKSSRFTQLSVKSIPAGTTLTVTCKGKGCPKTFVKRNAPKSVSIKPLLRKPLHPGTTITIVDSRPNAISAIKVLKIRAGRKPSIATRCQAPGGKVASSC